MAVTVTPAVLGEGVVLGGGATTIVPTVPASEVDIVHSLYILNDSGSPETFSLNTTSAVLYKDVTVDSGDTWELPSGQIIVIESGDVLQFTGSNPGTLIASAYGAKHVTT